MGCICAKGICGPRESDKVKKSKKPSPKSVSLSKKDEIVVDMHGGELKPQTDLGSGRVLLHEEGDKKTARVESATTAHHQKGEMVNVGAKVGQSPMSRIVSLPRGAEGEQVVAGWPSWLSMVAGEAIKGWVPQRADSFEKLNKIGQGTYSSVYKARDLETGKIVAMKKVRFVNMDPESVRFMAREIYILRKLDHPNVMKLEGLVASRGSSSLYLVFEYMEHDLAGLAATRGIKFTESQIKCYMQQLFCGLEHCHSRGVLHRDMKGSNLLINNNGILKIADFGLASLFQPGQSQPLTSRVVTLWYRAPELLLGATEYGVSVDMWSTGCILAELFAGKPIMPGRTEVEQIHKIFKLCGSPSEGYWSKSKLPHATSFKPQQPYKRCLVETFKDFPPSTLSLLDGLLAIEPEDRGSAAFALKSEFFSTNPLPCDPSSIPKYPPSKEFDAKLRNEARKERAEAVRGRGPESLRRGSRDPKEGATPEFNHQGQGQPIPKSSINKPPKGTEHNGNSHSASMVHPMVAVPSSWSNKVKGEDATALGRALSIKNAELLAQKSHMVSKLSNSSQGTGDIAPGRDSTATVYVPKKSRIQYSGPLMPLGGNVDDMLKEHERQIQQAVRKARVRTKRSGYEDEFGESGLLLHPHHMENLL